MGLKGEFKMGLAGLLVVVLAIFVCPSGAQWLVGVGGTNGGTASGSPCVFPFIYKGVSYAECITNDNYFIPWCATTSNYDTTSQWSRCMVTIQANRTKGGNAGKSNCYFPFTYKGRQYYSCTTVDNPTNKPWCATSPNYARDKQWALCVRYPYIVTTGGNGGNAVCNFPFTYQNWQFEGCINTNNGGVGWCAVTNNYDRDKLWGNCVVTTTGGSGGTPAPSCPNGNTYTEALNTLSYGGAPTAAASRPLCGSVCDSNAACLGYDWNYNTGVNPRCFIHTNTANFGTKQSPVTRVNQWTLTRRCTNTPSPTPGGGGSATTTRGGNSGRSRCVFPYKYRRHWYTSCTSQEWFTPWCPTTADYWRDTLWGECDNIQTM